MVCPQKVVHSSEKQCHQIHSPVCLYCRPHLYIYAHSNELDETGVITLSGVKVEYNPDMEDLFGVSPFFDLLVEAHLIRDFLACSASIHLLSLQPQTRMRFLLLVRRSSNPGSSNWIQLMSSVCSTDRRLDLYIFSILLDGVRAFAS